jgi:hypothetical protein
MAKKKYGCLILILITVPLLLIAAAGWYSFYSYKRLQKEIANKIKNIEPFNSEAASKQAADELNLTIPIKEPSISEDEIHKAANKELKQIARKKILSSNLSLKTKAIIKKYSVAKDGDQVSFMLNTTGKRISGTYKGTFTDWKGKLIKVDHNKYRIYDINTENRYYFDSTIAQKMATEKIATLKKEFNEKRKNVMINNKEKVLKKHYTANGYRQDSRSWKPNSEVYANLMKEKENKHIQGIYEKNKLFGIITVAIDEEKEKDFENEKE